MATSAELASQYGYSQAFFMQDAELAKLIKDATNGQWTTARFQAQFMMTNFYRSHEASVRQWTDLTTRDPAEAADKIRQKVAELQDMSTQYGLNLDDATLNNWATGALMYGWTAQQTKDVFAANVNFNGPISGTPAATMAQVKNLANQYGLKLTDAQAADYTGGMLSDKYTEDNLRSFMGDMAKSKYSGMAPYIDMGMTVKQVASPYLQSYSNLLEVDADSINIADDPTLQQALQGSPPAANQPPQMQSVYQFEKNLRRDPRWLQTKNAKDSITNAGQSVLRDWGLVG